jgi:hypothetical protein
LQDADLPRVERDIYQIEQFSQHLSQKVHGSDPTSSYLDASRLLAQEGLNPRQYTLALQNFQIMPMHEDQAQQRGADVQTYVEQVHEALSSKAIQLAHENAVSSFEKHIDAYLDSTWQREKKALFDTGDPYGPSAQRRDQPQGKHVLRGKAAKYADVVKEMNNAIANGTKIESAVNKFAAACRVGSLTTKDAVGTTLLRLWTISERMLHKVADIPASAALQKKALMVEGVRYG